MKSNALIYIVGILAVIMGAGYFITKNKGNSSSSTSNGVSRITKGSGGCYQVPNSLKRGYSHEGFGWEEYQRAYQDYIDGAAELRESDSEAFNGNISYIRGFFAGIDVTPSRPLIKEYAKEIQDYISEKNRKAWEWEKVGYGQNVCGYSASATQSLAFNMNRYSGVAPANTRSIQLK